MCSNFPLQYFSIKKLFGKYDIHIDFDRVNIFVGDNGIGKTTILNCIYYILAGKFNKLMSIQFENIKLICNNREYVINRKDILTKKYRSRYTSERYPEFIQDEIRILKDSYLSKSGKRASFQEFFYSEQEHSPSMQRLLRVNIYR